VSNWPHISAGVNFSSVGNPPTQINLITFNHIQPNCHVWRVTVSALWLVPVLPEVVVEISLSYFHYWAMTNCNLTVFIIATFSTNHASAGQMQLADESSTFCDYILHVWVPPLQ
jgi:hypothetical protein